MGEHQEDIFFKELQSTFFLQHGKYFSAQHSLSYGILPFKEHAQFTLLVDTLSRKNKHHVMLQAEFPSAFYTHFMESFLQHLNNDAVPQRLHAPELIFIDVEHIMQMVSEQKIIERDITKLCEMLDQAHRYLLIAATHADGLVKKADQIALRYLSSQLMRLVTHPNCRLLIFTQMKPQAHEDFSWLTLMQPTAAESLAILHQQQNELEQFHHVLIPEELLHFAYVLAERYLSTSDTLEKALLLLDSSAGRVAGMEHNDHHQSKPVLTHAALIQVLSAWTHIPPTHLASNKFKMADFIQAMQQRIAGQEMAITLLAHHLLKAHARFQKNPGPFCRLLFAGPKHAGKKTMALALTEQLFKQNHAIYFVQLTTMQTALLDVKCQRHCDKRFFSLQEVITETPYAILMFEDIEQAPKTLIESLYELISTGSVQDAEGNRYHFHQASIIASTTLGVNRLAAIQPLACNEQLEQDMNLMQLVMNEQRSSVLPSYPDLSPHECVDEILPEIMQSLPEALCQQFTIIPFLFLNSVAIKKIIDQKMNLLSKMLHAEQGIEFSYALEVIHYLTDQVLLMQQVKQTSVDIDKCLQSVYGSIEQALLHQAEMKQKPNQLFLQLDERGQSLRCDWLMATTLRHHA